MQLFHFLFLSYFNSIFLNRFYINLNPFLILNLIIRNLIHFLENFQIYFLYNKIQKKHFFCLILLLFIITFQYLNHNQANA